MMRSFLLFPVAAGFAAVQKIEAFTPLPSSRQSSNHGRRLPESRSTVFDTEQASPWTTQEWTATDLSASLKTLENQFLSTPPKENNFLPSEDDFQIAEQVLSAPNPNRKNASSGSKLESLEEEFSSKKKLTASVTETGTDSMKNYMKTMCNHELLNKNEEIILAREIQTLLKWEAQREDLELELLR